MAPPADWLTRLARVVGPTGPPKRIGHDIWKVSAGGRTLVAKLGPDPLDEADGLGALWLYPGRRRCPRWCWPRPVFWS